MTRLATYLLFLIFCNHILASEDWPEFRGPTGQGHSERKNVPLRWSDKEHVKWKTEVPGLGWSSPVYSHGEIWLTTSLNEGSELRACCFEMETGDLKRNIVVFGENSAKSIHGKNSHASPTPLLQGDRVYVHFGTYGTACLSRAGDILWKAKLDYEPQHGPGGSPVLFENLLIINCDGTDIQFVVALDKNSGDVLWKTPRTHASEARLTGKKSPPMAFSTPLIIEHQGQPLVISAGSDHVAAYDARTGKEVWWSQYDGYSVVPRPVSAHGMIFVSSSYDGPELFAVRLGGQGNVTDSHVAWTLKKGAPHNPSPIVVDNEIYVVSDRGILTCLDAVDGKKHWQKRIGGNFSASPIYVDGRIYLTDEKGNTTVIQPGKKYVELAKNSIGDRTLASLAPLNGGMLIRTQDYLYRIEN